MSFGKNLKGIVGEDFVRKYCKKNNINFEKTEKEQDRLEGVDCYMDGIPTDVKNTEFIYFLHISFTGDILVRHPFKINSKATHYCFVDVNNKGDGFFKEFVPVRTFLLNNYFEDVKHLNSFFKYLKEIDGKEYITKGYSVEQAAFTIKKEILEFLKDDIGVSYEMKNDKHDVVVFRLCKKEKEKKIIKESIEEKPIMSKREKEIIIINL